MKKLLYLPFLALIFFLSFSIKSFAGNDERIPLVNSGEVIKTGRESYDNQKYKEAIEQYVLVPRNDTNYLNAQYELALAYLKMDSAELCVNVCKKAMEMPMIDHAMSFLMLLGDAYDQSGKFSKAIETYNEGIKKYPYNHKFWFEMGVSYANNKNDTAAMRCFKKSMSMNPLHAGSHLQLGVLAARNNHFTEALISLQMFLLIENSTQRSLQVLIIAESISNGDYKVNLDSIVDIKAGNTFETIEEIIRSKSALRSEYKTKVKLSYVNLIKTLQVLNEQLAYSAGDNNYWMQTYVPFFNELWKKQYFEEFIYHIFTSINDKESQAEIKKNQGSIDKMIDWAGTFISEKFPREKFTLNGKEIPDMPSFYDNGQIKYIGTYYEKEKVNKGDFIYYHNTGNLKAEGKYNDKGERQGVWKFYFVDGVMKEKVNYENGVVSGPYEFYFNNGQLREKCSYANGKIDGPKETYYAGGNISVKQNLNNGITNGKVTTYFETGDLKKELNLSNDLFDGSYKEYFPNHNLYIETTYSKGKESGNMKRYYANGVLEKEGKMANDMAEGEWKYYFDSGKLKRQGSFKGGKETGVWKEFYENGKPESEETYSNGMQNGIQRNYDDDGVMYSEITFNNNSIKKYKYFDKTGKVVSEGSESSGVVNFKSFHPDGVTKFSEGKIVKGLSSGPWVFYHSTGQKKQEITFVDGNLDGERKDYYKNGTLKETSNYKAGLLDGYDISYFKNGVKEEEGWFVDDERAGVWNTYYPNGKLENIYYYQNGKSQGYNEFYDVKGRLDFEDYYDQNDIFSFTTTFDTLGNVLYKGKVDKGTGALNSVHMNKKPKINSAFDHGNRSGKWEYFYSNGKPQSSFIYKDGRLNGPYTQFFEDGTKKTEGFYLDGKIDSTYKLYNEAGRLVYESNYKSGDLQGKATWYHDNGKQMRVGNYVDDNRDGYFLYYGMDGSERMRLNYEDGKLISYSYKDKSGNYVPEIPVQNETVHIVAYYQNGNKSADQNIVCSYFDGKYILYHSNGKIEIEKEFKAHEESGEEKEYYENGQLKTSTNYYYGLRDGLRKSYNDKGILISQETYVIDVKEGKTTLNDKVTGKLLKTIWYVNDQPYQR